MRIALVHDDLVQWGGAEKVLLALSEIFPEAPIYTSVFDRNNLLLKKKFAGKKIRTSFLQKLPGWRNFYKALLPLYPIAFEQFDFSRFDIVISQTTRFAKVIITKPETKHICYCHTPPRFLWNFSGEKILGGLGLFGGFGYLKFLRNYDRVTSSRADLFIAGSRNAQARIEKVYGLSSKVIYPFVDLERFKGVRAYDGDYLMVIARLNFYKRVDLVVRAANRLKLPLKVVGIGPEEGRLKELAGPTVEFLGRVNEEKLGWLFAGCRVLVVAGEEDFGLTVLEAQALGKPVVAFAKGGALETVIEGATGFLFSEQTVDSLIGALMKLDKKGWYNKKRCLEQAAKFSKERFTAGFQNLIDSL